LRLDWSISIDTALSSTFDEEGNDKTESASGLKFTGGPKPEP
jgi:hypothetical protein